MFRPSTAPRWKIVDEHLAPGARLRRPCARGTCGAKPEAHERQPAVLQEDCVARSWASYLLWNSGEPSTSASACDERRRLARPSPRVVSESVAGERRRSMSASRRHRRAARRREPAAVGHRRRRAASTPVSETAKFMRFRSAPVLTQASARVGVAGRRLAAVERHAELAQRLHERHRVAACRRPSRARR